jgi:cytoskeletal protein RodZ
MADVSDKSSDRYVRESTYRVEPVKESSGSMWFIIGGIVVAVAVLFAIFYGNDDGVATVPASTDNSVTIENNDPALAPTPDATVPADTTTPADATAPADAIAPAPEATETAPADTTAPAAPAETAPAAPAAGN